LIRLRNIGLNELSGSTGFTNQGRHFFAFILSPAGEHHFRAFAGK
jgi:hypothetical protein